MELIRQTVVLHDVDVSALYLCASVFQIGKVV